MTILNPNSAKSLDRICRYCLTAAIEQTWQDEEQGVNIDTLSVLITNYRLILTLVFSALNLDYPPFVAWTWLFEFLRVIKGNSPLSSDSLK